MAHRRQARGDDFATREGLIDGIYSTMLVNRALKNLSGRDTYAFHLRVFAAYTPTGPRHLPSAAEVAQLDSIESALLDKVGTVTAAVYVGHTTWNGGREFNFYVEDPHAVDSVLDATLGKAPLPVEAEIVEDPDWLRVDFFFNYDN